MSTQKPLVIHTKNHRTIAIAALVLLLFSGSAAITSDTADAAAKNCKNPPGKPGELIMYTTPLTFYLNGKKQKFKQVDSYKCINGKWVHVGHDAFGDL